MKAKVIFENIKDTFNLIKSCTNLNKFYLDIKNNTQADFYFNRANYLSDVFQSYGFKTAVLVRGIESNIQKGTCL